MDSHSTPRATHPLSLILRLGLIVLLFASLAWSARPAQAGGGEGTLWVTPNGSDSAACKQVDPCSLARAQTFIVSDGFAIQMAAGTYYVHDFPVRYSLTISGPWVPMGAAPQVTLDAQNLGRVLDVQTTVPHKIVNLQYLTVRNGKMTDNNGAGIRCIATDLMILQVNVQNNTLIDTPSGVNFGGAGIYSADCNLDVVSSLISGNSGGTWGGGIYLSNSLNWIANSTISGNQLDTGNGGGGVTVSGGETALYEVTISGNTASHAAGLFVNPGDTGTFLMNRSTVSGNHSLNSGGGLVLYNSATIMSSTISGNSADAYGGGVLLDHSGASMFGNLTIDHVTLTNNSAGYGGSGVYFSAAGTQLNTSDSILDGTAGDICAGPTIATTTGGHNLVADASCPLPNLGVDIFGKDPGLTSLGNYGGRTQTHALQWASPAINGGTPACGSTDQRGVTRDNVCDIGAYEYNQVPIFLPLVRR